MDIVITGASRGIGAGLADHYRQAGHKVTGTSRKGGGGLVQADVGDPASVRALAQQAGPVDLLICNAGIYPDKGQSLGNGYGAGLWADTFATNVTGVFLTIEALLPALRARRGRIAIISSKMASDAHAQGGAYIYRASKAAVLNLGRNLAQDLRGDGIAVGIYHPGWVRTDMGGSGADISVAQSVQGLTAEFDLLSLDTTGCFRGWDGQDIPF